MSQLPLLPVFAGLPLSPIFIFFISFLLTLSLSLAGRIQAWQPAAYGGLLITEFYYNPPGLDEEREWIEVANLGDQPVQLAGYGLGDEEKIGEGEGMLRFPEGRDLGPGEAIVVAQTAVGFRALFGARPDFEIEDTDTAVPDMLADPQWAPGQVALANRGDELILVDDQNNLIDALNYGDRVTYFTPAIPTVVSGQSLERFPAFCDTDSAVDWRPQKNPTPGKLIMEGQCNSAPKPDGDTLLRAVGEIQGTGDVSPLLNQKVTFRGLVTGMMEDQNASGVIYYTLFVQDIPSFEDGDPDTSDAIAVFLGRQQPKYQIGDQVMVTGQVTEYFGLTEIDDNDLIIELETSAQPLPDAVPIEMPQDPILAANYLETREAMLVKTSGWLPVIGPTHPGCGFAVGSTADTVRPVQHSGAETYPPPLLVLHHSDVHCSVLPALKSGDLVADISGPLTFHFEQYKVVQQDTESLQVKRGEVVQVRAPLPESQNWVRVATLNLDNYLAPSPTGDGGGFSEVSSERLSLEEFKIKQRKLAYTISHVLGCPELLGVQEVESEALLVELATMTEEACGFQYQVTHRESADARGIDVALLSDPRRVAVGEATLHQLCSQLATGVHDTRVHCPSGENPLFSRPPLVISLRVDGEPLTIIVNHFKSKRGGDLETAPRRRAQAQHVHELVQNQLARDPQGGIIVLGDFNDFNLSAVWQQLQAGGVLVDMMHMVSPQERYSYIFDGVSQLVEGILVSPGLVHRVANVTIFHVNADYPLSFALDDSPSGISYHASDHDPLIITIGIPSHSDIVATATKTGTGVEPAPTALIQPTVKIANDEQVPPTSQTTDRVQPESGFESTHYLVFAGFGLFLMVTVVLWFAKRGST